MPTSNTTRNLLPNRFTALHLALCIPCPGPNPRSRPLFPGTLPGPSSSLLPVAGSALSGPVRRKPGPFSPSQIMLSRLVSFYRPISSIRLMVKFCKFLFLLFGMVFLRWSRAACKKSGNGRGRKSRKVQRRIGTWAEPIYGNGRNGPALPARKIIPLVYLDSIRRFLPLGIAEGETSPRLRCWRGL